MYLNDRNLRVDIYKLTGILTVLFVLLSIPVVAADVSAASSNPIDKMGIEEQEKERARPIYEQIREKIRTGDKSPIKIENQDKIFKLSVQGSKTRKSLKVENEGQPIFTKEDVELFKAQRDGIGASSIWNTVCNFGVSTILFAVGLAVLAALYASGEGFLFDFIFFLVDKLIESGVFNMEDHSEAERNEAERQLNEAQKEQQDLSKELEEKEKELKRLENERNSIIKHNTDPNSPENREIKRLEAEQKMLQKEVDEIDVKLKRKQILLDEREKKLNEILEKMKSNKEKLDADIEERLKRKNLTEEEIADIIKKSSHEQAYKGERTLLIGQMYESFGGNYEVEFDQFRKDMLEIIDLYHQNGSIESALKSKNLPYQISELNALKNFEDADQIARKNIANELRQSMDVDYKDRLKAIKAELAKDHERDISIVKSRYEKIKSSINKDIGELKSIAETAKNNIKLAGEKIMNIRKARNDALGEVLFKMRSINEVIPSIKKKLATLPNRIVNLKTTLSALSRSGSIGFFEVVLKVFNIIRWILKALTGVLLMVLVGYVSSFICNGIFPNEVQITDPKPPSNPDKPGDKAPDKPAPGNPDKPGDKVPGDPDDRIPDRPVPDKPGDNTPGRPNPDRPNDKLPGKPGEQNPNVPDTGRSGGKLPQHAPSNPNLGGGDLGTPFVAPIHNSEKATKSIDQTSSISNKDRGQSSNKKAWANDYVDSVANSNNNFAAEGWIVNDRANIVNLAKQNNSSIAEIKRDYRNKFVGNNNTKILGGSLDDIKNKKPLTLSQLFRQKHNMQKRHVQQLKGLLPFLSLTYVYYLVVYSRYGQKRI